MPAASRGDSLAVSAGDLGKPEWAASGSLCGQKWRGAEFPRDSLLCLSLSPACEIWELEVCIPLEMFLRYLESGMGIGFY